MFISYHSPSFFYIFWNYVVSLALNSLPPLLFFLDFNLFEIIFQLFSYFCYISFLSYFIYYYPRYHLLLCTINIFLHIILLRMSGLPYKNYCDVAKAAIRLYCDEGKTIQRPGMSSLVSLFFGNFIFYPILFHSLLSHSFAYSF